MKTSYSYTLFADYYRARIYYGDLNSLSDDGLDGDDHYKVALWRSEPGGLRNLKSRIQSLEDQ